MKAHARVQVQLQSFVTFWPQRWAPCPLNKRLRASQNQFGCFEEAKNFLRLPRCEPWFLCPPARSLVAIATRLLSLLVLLDYCNHSQGWRRRHSNTLWGSNHGRGTRSSLPTTVQAGCGTHPAFCSTVTCGSFWGGEGAEQPRREFDRHLNLAPQLTLTHRPSSI